MANPEGFRSDPDFAWGFYGHRLNLYRNTVPHNGFNLLKKWVELKNNNFFVFTSNVDGHFQRSGFPEDKIEECHGSINYFQCTSSCPEIWDAGSVAVTINTDTMRAEGDLPLCERCGLVARPNILMFGDWNWISERTHIQHKKLLQWREGLSGKKLVIIECGAGTAVPTVRYMSEKFLDMFNAVLIRINKREPQVPHGSIGINEGALDTLSKIDSIISDQIS